MTNYFTYGANANAPKSSDFGLIVTAVNPFNSAAFDITKKTAYGINGDILLGNARFQNISVVYEVAMLNITNTRMDSIRQWLLGADTYQRIYDSYDTTIFREGIFSGSIDWTLTQLQRHGKAKITFSCKPQRWIISLSDDNPTIVTTETASITNTTANPEFPKIVYKNIEYTAPATLTVGFTANKFGIDNTTEYFGGTYTFTNTSDSFLQITVDTETMTVKVKYVSGIEKTFPLTTQEIPSANKVGNVHKGIGANETRTANIYKTGLTSARVELSVRGWKI